MPRKENKAVPEGNNGPVPRQEELGLANPRWRTYIECSKNDSIDRTGTGTVCGASSINR